MNTLVLPVEFDRGHAFVNPITGNYRPVLTPSRASKLKSIRAIIEGDTSQSVTFTVRIGVDPSVFSNGTEVITGGSTTTATTAAEVFSSLDFADIAAGDCIWIVLTTVSGVVRTFTLTFEYE